MSIQPQPMNEQEHQAIIDVCILAAFADGAQDDVERAQIQRIVNGFSEGQLDPTSAYQDVLEGKLSLSQAAAQLQAHSAKALAYEMAICVCHADGALNDQEKQFVADLRQALQVDGSVADLHQQRAQALVEQPLTSPAPPAVMDPSGEVELDRMILNSAILNGALEIMPHSLATMAIIPVQMRMVYQIGKATGMSWTGATSKSSSIGLTSQVFEGSTRRLAGGLARGLAYNCQSSVSPLSVLTNDTDQSRC